MYRLYQIFYDQNRRSMQINFTWANNRSNRGQTQIAIARPESGQNHKFSQNYQSTFPQAEISQKNQPII